MSTVSEELGWCCLAQALDPATGKILYRIRSRKRHSEFLDLLKALRARWPGEKLHLGHGQLLAAPRHPDVRTWADRNRIELVFFPTYSSWLNWIEAEFAALCYFALNGTDHRSHTEQNAAIAACIRWRNARARAKTGFATDSPIRIWTHYPANVA